MPLIYTRSQKAIEVLSRLKKGPSFCTIGTQPLRKKHAQEAGEQYQRWVQTWVIPIVEELLEKDISKKEVK